MKKATRTKSLDSLLLSLHKEEQTNNPNIIRDLNEIIHTVEKNENIVILHGGEDNSFNIHYKTYRAMKDSKIGIDDSLGGVCHIFSIDEWEEEQKEKLEAKVQAAYDMIDSYVALAKA